MLELVIVPNISRGSARPSLKSLRVSRLWRLKARRVIFTEIRLNPESDCRHGSLILPTAY